MSDVMEFLKVRITDTNEFKFEDECYVDGDLIEAMKVIRRNGGVVCDGVWYPAKLIISAEMVPPSAYYEYLENKKKESF